MQTKLKMKPVLDAYDLTASVGLGAFGRMWGKLRVAYRRHAPPSSSPASLSSAPPSTPRSAAAPSLAREEFHSEVEQHGEGRKEDRKAKQKESRERTKWEESPSQHTQ